MQVENYLFPLELYLSLWYDGFVEINNTNEVVEYWLTGSENNFKSAQALFHARQFSDSLFFSHLMIEKILKALIVKRTNVHAPRIHNLATLAGLTDTRFIPEQLDLLDEISTFNIEARYDDYKYKFYKKATEAYAQKYLLEATELFQWLKNQIQ